MRANPGMRWSGGEPRGIGMRANTGLRGERLPRANGAAHLRVADASAYGNWRYAGITPVSAEARQAPRPPSDAAVRAGSIREDVARYNEERASFRPLSRGNADVPHPPMPSPYRN